MKKVILLLLLTIPLIVRSQDTIYYRQSYNDTTCFVREKQLPPLDDSLIIIYHEPNPDSVYPAKYVYIGSITFINKSASQILDLCLKYARQNGANCIMSFREPRLRVKQGVYYASAKLIYVTEW